jgi:hypothetical protein
MFGLGENYLSAMAVFMGFTALQISILNSLPQLVGAFAQLATHSLTRAFSSMKVFVVSLSLVQSFMWIVLIYIISQTSSYTVILSWSVTYYAISSIIGPAWISWMGYLVPLRIRANYHANRNRIIHFIIFISILVGGLILKVFQNNMVLGFSIMFGIGSLGRLISSYYLNKKNDKGDRSVNSDYSYRDILADKTKVIFIIYNTSIHFSVMFLGPLFTIYILRTMELSYFVLTLCMVSWWMGNVFSSRMWGRISKRKGNLYLLKLSTLLMCILPALWISVYYFSPTGRVVVSLIINLMAGISFAAFGLSSFNILYDMCSKDEVIKFSSLINCLKGVGVFAGSVIAGMIVDSSYIIDTLSQYNFTSIQLSMLISIILRSMSLIFLSNLKVKT